MLAVIVPILLIILGLVLRKNVRENYRAYGKVFIITGIVVLAIMSILFIFLLPLGGDETKTEITLGVHRFFLSIPAYIGIN